MDIIVRPATKNPCYQAGRRIIPKGIMIHSIGVPQPDPEVIVNNFNQPDADSCVHAVIGLGEEVYQLLPWDYRAWHCGSGPNGSGNNTYISFEMTEPSTIRYTSAANWVDLDPAATRSFVQRIYKGAVRLAAYLCRLYAFDPEGKDVIISHVEGHRMGIASNHADVEHLWDREGLSMAQFRRDVAAEVKNPGGDDGEENPYPYIVQAGAFQNEENARRLVEQLEAAGFSAYVRKI